MADFTIKIKIKKTLAGRLVLFNAQYLKSELLMILLKDAPMFKAKAPGRPWKALEETSMQNCAPDLINQARFRL